MDSNEDGASTSKELNQREQKENQPGSSSRKDTDKKWSAGGKRLKKDDSGIHVMPESDSSEDSSYAENKKLKSSNQSGPNSPDSGNLESNSLDLERKMSDNKRTFKSETLENSDISDSNDETSLLRAAEGHSTVECEDVKRSKTKCKRKDIDFSSDDDDDDDDHDYDDDDDEEEKQKKEREAMEKDYEKYDPTPLTPRPVHRWCAPNAVISRQYGFPCNYSPDLFRFNCYGSLHVVQRLELMYKMKKHDGCVNTLNFNNTGTKLVSGSDDLDIILWDWTTSEPILTYKSGHTSNVFQAKFLPFSGDCHIVSCARDGQVRLAELSTSGVCKGTRQLGQHQGAIHKLALHKDNPHIFMSCSEDSLVYLFDVRIERRKDNPQKLVSFMEHGRRVPLYTVACNPQNPHEFVVGGRSSFIKVFDSRYTREEGTCVRKFCPSHLVGSSNVSSAVYNYNGQEILASYNEDIYLFSSQETKPFTYLHRYRGHRNKQTIKGVNFFGSKSEFVVSGSDCGYIFFWEKESEHIVKYMYGDEMGVVNCIEPHPNMPVLATSGLDDDIKIWVPSCENEPDLSGLKKHLIDNMREEAAYHFSDPSGDFIDQSLMIFMQHLTRARFPRRSLLREGRNRDSSSSSLEISFSDIENNGEDDDDDDDSDDDGRPALQCTQS